MSLYLPIIILNMKQRPHLLNLLNYKLFILKNKKFIEYIDKIMSLDAYKNIKIDYLDSFTKSKYKNEIFSIDDMGTITFLHHQNLIKFGFNNEDLTSTIRGVLNINIKNQQCYELIQTIVKLQLKFIHSNNKQDLKYISHNTYYRDKNNNIFKLNYLLPKQHFILYIKCRYLLNEDVNMADKALCIFLKNRFDITTSKTKIFEMRKRYLIPNKKFRTQNIYLEYEKNYSIIYHLTYENIKQYNFQNGVYELLSLQPNNYHFKSSRTVYIGSSNDIKRRLTSYICGFGHTLKLREFISGNDIYFRTILSKNYKDLEKDILNAFYSSYGEYCILNTNRVL